MRSSIRTSLAALCAASLLALMSCPNPLMIAVMAKVARDESRSISLFNFQAAENARLYKDVAGTVDEGTHAIDMTVPKWTPLTDLVANFQWDGGTVTVNGVAQESGVTANDFSQPVKYTVTPASGAPVEYTVNVMVGSQGLMGGVIQGVPLTLGGTVTTVAGKASVFGTPNGVVRINSDIYVADGTYSVIWKVNSGSGATTVFAGMMSEPGYADAPSGPLSSARFSFPFGLATDGTYIYVADTGNNRIRRIDVTNGYVTTLTGTGTAGYDDGLPATATFDAPEGLFLSGSTLYETDLNNAIVRTIDTSNGNVTTIVPYGNTDFLGPVDIVKYGSNLYVTDQYNNAIYQIDGSNVVTRWAGTGTGVAGYADGPGVTTAQFSGPAGLAVSVPLGTLYVADSGNQVIRAVDLSTAVVSTYAGLAGQLGSADNYGASSIRFNGPYMLSVQTGNPQYLYITEYGNTTLRRIQGSLMFSTTIAGTPSGSANGTGSAVRFYVPRMLNTNGTTLWIDDEYNHVIRAMDIATSAVTTAAGQVGVAAEQDGTGTGAAFNYPYGVTNDGKSLFVCDTYGMTIRRMNLATGVVTTFAGSPNQAGFANGIGTAARFQRPTGITTDGTSLYVTDYLNNSIRRIEIATAAVTTLAGSAPGNVVTGDDDGIGTAASFRSPIDLTTDGTNLYVSDNGNRKIRKIVIATAEVTTLAGPAPGIRTPGYVNGIGTAARFALLVGITTDGANLYVADTNNNVIRKIDIASRAVSTLAGPPEPDVKPGSIDGTGSAARFNSPFGITTDGVGLFVTDQASQTVRRIR